jgi:hypothetical protein
VVLVGSAADSLEIGIPATAIIEGWNQVAVDLAPPYNVSLNGSTAGQLTQVGSTDPLSRISEIRWGLVAGAGGLDSSFTFWLDEWHLAESRYRGDLSLYAETTSGYRGGLWPIGGRTSVPLLTDPMVNAGFQHQDGVRDSWFTGFRTTLLSNVPLAVDLSGYRDSAGGLFRDSPDPLPGDLEERDRQFSYSHQIGVEPILPFLPSLEHGYQRSTGTDNEVGLSDNGYLFDTFITTAETLSFAQAYRYPEGFQQNYDYTRRWLYGDRQRLLIDTPPLLLEQNLDLSVSESHSGGISYTWIGNFLSLDLGREQSYEVAAPDMPATLGDSYLQRLADVLRSIPAAHPGAEVDSRKDRGRLFASFPRKKYLGFTAALESSFSEMNFQSGSGNRDVSLRDSLDLSIPFSPGGKGILEITPSYSRGFSGSYGNTGAGIEEMWILGQSWKKLLLPPLRPYDYTAVDLLAGAPEVAGAAEAQVEHSLALALRLRDSPWYLPARSRLEIGGQTGREGESYTQSRSFGAGLGRDFLLTTDSGMGSRRLSLDAGWQSSWDYADKIVSHELRLDTALHLAAGIRGRLSANHRLALGSERQRIGDEDLLLFPGQPGREVEVPFQPDIDTIFSVLGVEYSREREIDEQRRKLLASYRLGDEESATDIGRISHRDRLELENTFLVADRGELNDTTIVPLRLFYTHSTLITVSEYLDLDFSIKAIAGAEEIVTQGSSEYKPALGFELRLTGILNF